MSNTDTILLEALALEPAEKLALVEKILASFYVENKGVEAEWNAEVEERIKSYAQGNIPSFSEDDTFSKYKG